MKKFRVAVIRKEKFEVEVMADDVTHAEDIVNTVLGNMGDVVGIAVTRDFNQFPRTNAANFLEKAGRHVGTWTEIEWTHDAE